MLNCQFRLESDATYVCAHPIDSYKFAKARLCIFHSPKLTEEEKQNIITGGNTTREKKLEQIRNKEDEFRERFIELAKQMGDDPEVKYYDFRGFHFPIRSIFDKVVFVKDADFCEANFQGVGFARITFGGRANFFKASFNKGGNFEETKFIGESIFEKAYFNEVAYFLRSSFDNKAIFSQATFECDVTFMLATFKGEVHFDYVTFPEKSEFDSITFEQDAWFSQTTFKQTAWFSNTNFKGSVYLNGIQFNASALFDRAVFWKEAMFMETYFNGKSSFRETTFKSTAIFSKAVFSSDIRFIGYGSNECFSGQSLFNAIEIQKEAEVIFERVRLAESSFLDTDLERITFRDVKWYQWNSKLNNWHRRRRALWDEFREISEGLERDYEKITENYRQLVLNFESKRDWNAAEDFHIGEMETQRKKKGVGVKPQWWGKVRRALNPYGVYWVLSNYGSSYWQAFWVLIGMILLFSLVFFFTGFQTAKENDGLNRVIEYNLSFTPSTWVPISQCISDFWRAILFTLSIITFQRERFYEPANDLSRLWLFIAVFILTTQMALILLAVRRRFKR